MKRILLTSIACLFLTAMAHSQNKAMNYQGVARDASGQPMANKTIKIKLNILNSANANVYEETHEVTTNAMGLFNVLVGQGTTTGNYASLNWTGTSHQLKVSVDPNGGTTYTDLGKTPLAGVPYAHTAQSLASNTDGGRSFWSSKDNPSWNIYQSNTQIGYFGSVAGTGTDVDFGTSSNNSSGRLHFTIKGAPAITISATKKVSINRSLNDDNYPLSVNGATGNFDAAGITLINTAPNKRWTIYPMSTGDMLIGNNSAGNLGRFNGVTGAYTALSDRRMKTNIRPLESVLDKVMQITPSRYEYKYNNPDKIENLGFIAQDVKAIFPELVSENTTNEGEYKVENLMMLDYASMSIIAIKAIQEQQAIIKELKKEIEDLKAALKK